jgi:proline dehydrogenase
MSDHAWKGMPMSSDIRQNALLSAVASSLKKLALNQSYRDAFVTSPLLRESLWPAASRYVVAKDRPELYAKIAVLAEFGYLLSVEHVGEEVRDLDEIDAIVAEYEAVIDAADPHDRSPLQLGFDLSSMGSLVSTDLAYENTARLLKAAAGKNIGIILSMERSTLVDEIMEIHGALARDHHNIGITLQAHLRRTTSDIDTIAARGGKVRLVKGVYDEDTEVAFPRGSELNRRYVELLGRLTDLGVTVSAATQDVKVHNLMDRAGLLERVAEVEMLHGVRPLLLRGLRDRGIPTRVYAVYGQNWWLHFLHRLAEYPRTVLLALADLDDPTRIEFGRDYR